MESKPSLEEVEKILCYKFKNKNLLEEAFTHHLPGSKTKRYLPNERLELIGDSVLNLIITREFFSLYPNLAARDLTQLRSNNTDNEKLARAAVQNELHKFIINRNPIRDEQVGSINPSKIQVFMEEIRDYPIHSHGLVNVPKVLADIVESTIGAVYIDSNCSLETVWKVVEPILEPIIYLNMLKEHPGAKLLHICQKNKLDLQYDTEPWERDATVSIFIEKKLVGKATYPLKKDIAVNRAAKNTLDNIDSLMTELGVNYNSSKDKDKIKEDEEEEEHEDESDNTTSY